MSPSRYPIEPLLARLGGRSLTSCFGEAGRTTISAARRRGGLTEQKADEYAAKLGLVAYEVWPEMLDAAIADTSAACIECAQPFHPVRKGHVFCSRACLERRYKRERYRRDAAYREAVKAASRRRTVESKRAISIKKARYYRANRDEIRARQNAYAAARRMSAAEAQS